MVLWGVEVFDLVGIVFGFVVLVEGGLIVIVLLGLLCELYVMWLVAIVMEGV